MATSSIFKNFIVDDQESIRTLFDALTKDRSAESENDHEELPTLQGKELEEWLDRVWPTR